MKKNKLEMVDGQQGQHKDAGEARDYICAAAVVGGGEGAMTNGEFKIKRRKGKWRHGMMVCCDCNMQPVRVGDIVRLRYDKLVAYDFGGEFAENYLQEVTTEEINELTNILTKAFSAWAAKHGYKPDFYPVENVQEYEL